MDVSGVDIEFEFSGLPKGEFSGYGAIFGNIDSHADVIEPGAFKDTLAARGAEGRGLPMHVMHGLVGGGLPVGVWKSVGEDSKGLRVVGKISGMNTEIGKMHYERLKDGAYGGLSIGYSVAPGGARKGSGRIKRHLTKLNLKEISLVDDPSNAMARVDAVKRRRAFSESPINGAADRLEASISLFETSRFRAGTERDLALQNLSDALEAMTGSRIPIVSGVPIVTSGPRLGDEIRNILDAMAANISARSH